MNRIVLSPNELEEIGGLLNRLTSRYSSVEDPELLRTAAVHAHELPLRVRKFLNEFRLLECTPGIGLISGYPINPDRIGETPSHWKNKNGKSSTLQEEILLVLFGSLLGEPLAWATQQDAHIVHDVMPIKGNEGEQLGTGSEQLLWWHTEDAFHPYRGDYVGMMCLRNPDRVATTVASIDLVELDPKHREVLFERRYFIRPDESHLEKNSSGMINRDGLEDDLVEDAYRRMNEINNNPLKVAVLFGHPKSPYLRIDPYFMDLVEEDRPAREALDELIQAIDRNLIDLILEPGDYCFIDNYKAVHGRKPFKARYDGKDRWLKRINIARDLRKSRDARVDCLSRVIC